MAKVSTKEVNDFRRKLAQEMKKNPRPKIKPPKGYTKKGEPDQRGGKREGAGRKPGDPTVTVTFRVNAAADEICRQHFGRSWNAEINKFVLRVAKKLENG